MSTEACRRCEQEASFRLRIAVAQEVSLQETLATASFQAVCLRANATGREPCQAVAANVAVAAQTR